MLGIVWATVSLVSGWAVCRLLRTDVRFAPAVGLAAVAALATWSVSVLAPILPLALALLAIGALWDVRAHGLRLSRFENPWPVIVLVVSAVVPALLLGVAFANLDVPISNHDGAFHVETIDAVRRGQSVLSWYPPGFHASVAALLRFVPWVDTARGTVEAAQALTILTPLAVFGLGRSLGARPLVAACAALIQALTFILPYDFHLWGGWPLGMGVLLVLGLSAVVLAWIEAPSPRLALLAGGLGGAIVLTHGTEVYTSALIVAVILVARARRIVWRALPTHLPLAVLCALLLAAPYLPHLVGWAQGGGAVDAGHTELDTAVLDPSLKDGGLWVQLLLGAVGASAWIDWPVRLALVMLGVRQAGAGLTRGLWLTFVGVLLVFDAPHVPPTDYLFSLTFPWLADQRLLQLASVFASLLAAGGLGAALDWLGRARLRLGLSQPNAARRLALASFIALGFIAEGSAVSIYKRLAIAATNDAAYTADDRLAMAWLRQRVRPGDVIANDYSSDAGIWAPYKADASILLPSVGGTPSTQRDALMHDIAAADSAPQVTDLACQLDVRYIYFGARLYGYEARHFPPPTVLAQSTAFAEAFRSGDAVVFETRQPCA